jgi:hypothetical protein
VVWGAVGRFTANRDDVRGFVELTFVVFAVNIDWGSEVEELAPFEYHDEV